jgi:hypothetical protein
VEGREGPWGGDREGEFETPLGSLPR